MQESNARVLQPNTVAVVAAYNEQHCITACLRHLTQVASHVIVVNDNSTDRTAELANRFETVQVIDRVEGYTCYETGRRHLKHLYSNDDDKIVLQVDADILVRHDLQVVIDEQFGQDHRAEAMVFFPLLYYGNRINTVEQHPEYKDGFGGGDLGLCAYRLKHPGHWGYDELFTRSLGKAGGINCMLPRDSINWDHKKGKGLNKVDAGGIHFRYAKSPEHFIKRWRERELSHALTGRLPAQVVFTQEQLDLARIEAIRTPCRSISMLASKSFVHNPELFYQYDIEVLLTKLDRLQFNF